MKSKYLIQRNRETQTLTISEFSVLDMPPKRREFVRAVEDEYALLGAQTYDSQTVRSAIAKGQESLITLLRTPHLFPPQNYIQQIAAAIIDLYHSPTTLSTELVFDDVQWLEEV